MLEFLQVGVTCEHFRTVFDNGGAGCWLSSHQLQGMGVMQPQCAFTSGWPLKVVRMSGVANGVLVIATSTPASVHKVGVSVSPLQDGNAPPSRMQPLMFE